MSHFVLEIGTEELPARFLSSVEKELITRFSDKLEELNLSYKNIEAHSTPRRCILHIYGLEKVQPKHEEVAMGPSVNIAYDANGNLTKAGEGFVRGQGVALDQIFKTSNEKGEYIAVRKQVGGKKATEVLAEISPLIINALPFPKRMRWGEGTFAYARPLHWVLALLDNELIEFSVGKISSSTQTFGHRIHGIGPFSISHADELEKTLLVKSQIICDAMQRREIIIAEGNKAASEIQKDAKVIWEQELLDEVQGLVEKPVPLIGSFAPDFLELPKEVLLTTMEYHQKCFGIEDSKNALLPKFLTVLNIEPQSREVVREGWERVLRARLEDARFYWKEDLKDGFNQWLEMLDRVIFLGPLGSMGDKSRRLEQLCSWLWQKVNPQGNNLDDGISLAQRAGRLCKADLMSKMVGEFDTLQGIMGSIYALKDGLKPSFAVALREQYLPTGPDSPLPLSDLGAILSIADKVDTLVGCFGLGNVPTGTADPYALRRAALGITRILIGFAYPISLSELFEKAYSLYSPDIKWKFTKEETLEKLEEFCAARLKNFFIGDGAETLVAEAIMSAKDGHGKSQSYMVWATERRLNTLKEAMKLSDFAENVQTLKRMTNILAKSQEKLDGSFDETLFEADCERALGKSTKEFVLEFDKLWNTASYDKIMPLMGKIHPQVDAFFEGVMVMADDEKVRKNRMNMLFALMSRMGKLADFSLLQM